MLKFFGKKRQTQTATAASHTWKESSLTFESLSTTSRKGNIGLDRETAELRRLRRDGIRQTIAKMERAQQVDLCFLVDCTSSMRPWISAVKNSIKSLESKMREKYKQCTMRFAFVRYTDYDQPVASRISWLDFTRSTKEFVSFVDPISPEGGGDTAEDVIGGLRVVLNQMQIKWSSDKYATKILIHIADAPAHGKCFHSEGISDNRLEEDLKAFDPLMAKLKEQNIAYWFGYVQKHQTDRMVQQLDSLLQACKIDSAHSYTTARISQFDAVNPEKLLTALEDTVTKSISAMERSVGSRSLRRIPYTIQENSSHFIPEDCEDIEPVCVLEYSPLSTSDHNPISHFVPSPATATIRIKKAKQPFSEGAQNIVYHAREDRSGKRLVVKESKFQRSLEDKKSQYLTALHIYGLADYYAKLFNDEKPCNVPEIYFIEVKFCEQTTIVDGSITSISYIYEEYMEGKYRKYNTNCGWVNPEVSHYSAAAQAFSHYTWVKSEKQLIVCDLQGVTKSNKIFLTDPAIHCKEYMMLQPKNGGNNLGPPGIKKFFASHKCNNVCIKMKLKPFDE